MHNDDSRPGLREAKKASTRRALTRAAQTLALEHGLDGVTVEQVCVQVGVSVRTFFNYFESKDAAVLGTPHAPLPEQARAAFVAGRGDLLGDLLVLLDPTELLEHEGREGMVRAMTLAEREPRLLTAHLARSLAQERELAALVAQRRGLTAVDTGSSALAAVALALMRSACRDWFAAHDGTTCRQHLERTRAALAAALSTTTSTAVTTAA